MTAPAWYVGAIWPVTFVITDPATGLPVDPDTVNVEVVKPDGTVSIEAAARDTEGHYHRLVTLTAPGTWKAIAVTSGKYQGVGEQIISARRPR